MQTAAHKSPRSPPPKEWSVEIARVRSDMGLSQEKFGTLIGASQQIVSDWENGRRAPTRVYVKALIEKARARPDVFLTLSGVESADYTPEGRTSVRKELFRSLFKRLWDLYAAFGVSIESQDFAWRVYNLWTRALLLDHPETLVERIDFLLEQERQRLKRDQ